MQHRFALAVQGQPIDMRQPSEEHGGFFIRQGAEHFLMHKINSQRPLLGRFCRALSELFSVSRLRQLMQLALTRVKYLFVPLSQSRSPFRPIPRWVAPCSSLSHGSFAGARKQPRRLLFPLPVAHRLRARRRAVFGGLISPRSFWLGASAARTP